MIRIGRPFVIDNGQYAYLKARIDISADTSAVYLAASKAIKKVQQELSFDKIHKDKRLK